MNVSQQVQVGPGNSFFRSRPTPTAFDVPHLEDYLKELQASWSDTNACSRLCSIAFRPLSLPLFHLLCPQMKLFEGMLGVLNPRSRHSTCCSHGNLGKHLMLALSASLQEANVAADSITFCGASLETWSYVWTA